MTDYIQKADWKKEKHVPVIEVPETVKKSEPFMASIAIGREIPHPNTTEHHIRWVKLFFKPEEEKFIIHLGTFIFEAHAESTEGPNKGSAKTEPAVTTQLVLEKPGELVAHSYCNIHGLWEGTAIIKF